MAGLSQHLFALGRPNLERQLAHPTVRGIAAGDLLDRAADGLPAVGLAACERAFWPAFATSSTSGTPEVESRHQTARSGTDSGMRSNSPWPGGARPLSGRRGT